MTTWSKNIGICSALSALALTTACSDIKFAPAPDPVGNTTASTVLLPDGSVKDSFIFNQNGALAKVDVLFVDDNSASMENKQTRLGAALGSFVTSLGTVDWQLGITTTDTSDGPYGIKGSLLTFDGTTTTILNNLVPNYSTNFLNTIHRSEIGSGDERPQLAMIEAFAKRNAENAGFFRQNADLAVVILTDEDEASDGGPTATQPSEVIAAFQSAFGMSKNLTVYGIIIAPTDIDCYNSQAAQGSKYANLHASLVNMTGGVIGSICDTDYGPTLASIGNRVRDGVRTATLSQNPVSSTLNLVITPNDPSLTWTINGRVILFSKPPTKATRVDVIYKPI